MCTASSSARRNAGLQVIALQTSVGPIASSIFASGHSTTVTNGNMYSFFAIGGVRRLAVHDGRQQVVGASLLDDARRRRGTLAVTSVTPGACRSASIACEIASATPGTVNAARLASGWSGGSGAIAREPLGDRVGDLARVAAGPDARAVDAAAAAVQRTRCRPSRRDTSPSDRPGRRRSGSSRSRGRAPARADCRDSDRRSAVPPKIRLRPQLSSTAAPTSPPPGIDRDRLARNAGLEERLGHAVRRPRLLRARLEHQADLQRDDRQPQRVHAGRIRRQHQSERPGSAPG